MDSPVTRTESVKAWVEANGDYTLSLDYPLTDDSMVLDVGGFYGDWTAHLLDRVAPAKPRVYIFEPVKEFYASMDYRFREMENVVVLPWALSDRNGTTTISEDAEGSSMHKGMSSTTIRTHSVKDFLEAAKIDKVDLISINVEGHEFPILEHIIKERLLDKFENIQVQFHSFYPSADSLRELIRSVLSFTHTESYCYPFVWESWRKKCASEL